MAPPFWLAVLLAGTLVLTHCESTGDDEAADDSDDSDDDAPDDDAANDDSSDDDANDTTEGCSDDDSDELVVGTYTFTLNDGDTQVRIFRSDCIFCSQTLEEDETEADEDGEWSSEFDDDPAEAGQEITVTAGSIEYQLSGDGLTLEATDFDLTFSKDTSPNITCGGETAD